MAENSGEPDVDPGFVKLNRRRFFIAGLGGVLAAVAAPLWVPPAAQPVLPQFQITVPPVDFYEVVVQGTAVFRLGLERIGRQVGNDMTEMVLDTVYGNPPRHS